MTDKQIIEKLKTDLDFERSKRKTLQAELKAKEQECEELKKQACVLRPELKYIINEICRKYNINGKYYHEKIVEIINSLDTYAQTLIEIKQIAERNNDECFYDDFDCKDCDMEKSCTLSLIKQILQKCEVIK